MPIRFRAAALAACAIALSLTAGQALADPTLWVVKSKTATVYLFGSVHFLNPAQVWRTPAIDKAFRDSGELWQETPLPVTPKGALPAFTPEETRRIAQLMVSLGTTTDGPTLTSRLSADEAANLAIYVPVPKERLDRMRPWVAAGAVELGSLQQLGLKASSGADFVLAQEAVAQGKPIRGFETFEQQLHFFADLSPDEEMAYLRQDLANAAEGKARFEAIEQGWLAGDDEAVAKLFLGQMKDRSPVIYRRFVVERNQRWIPEIEAMLKAPGVRFVDVGDGHIVGPDGIVALLRKDGWRVERVR